MIATGLWAIGAIALLTLMYRAIPYKHWKNKKPGLVFFPKYIAQYSIPDEEIIANVKNMGFALKPGSSNIYAKGKAYGDFSEKAMKLHVVIDQKANSIKVYAPLIGVLFDTGDIWKITANILN